MDRKERKPRGATAASFFSGATDPVRYTPQEGEKEESSSVVDDWIAAVEASRTPEDIKKMIEADLELLSPEDRKAFIAEKYGEEENGADSMEHLLQLAEKATETMSKQAEEATEIMRKQAEEASQAMKRNLSDLEGAKL